MYKQASKETDRHIDAMLDEDVPLVEFMNLVFTRMPGESYRR